MPMAMKFGRTTSGRESRNQRFRMRKSRKHLSHVIARWPTLRDEFPLPAERGEGQGEGCLRNTRSFSGNVFKAFPSPRPSPLVPRREREKTKRRLLPVPLSPILRTPLYLKKL